MRFYCRNRDLQFGLLLRSSQTAAVDLLRIVFDIKKGLKNCIVKHTLRLKCVQPVSFKDLCHEAKVEIIRLSPTSRIRGGATRTKCLTTGGSAPEGLHYTRVAESACAALIFGGG